MPQRRPLLEMPAAAALLVAWYPMTVVERADFGRPPLRYVECELFGSRQFFPR